jgi:hypothetical protein
MVRQLNRSVLVNAPSSFALAFLGTYFLERGPTSEGDEISLRFPLPSIVIDGLTLEKRVRLIFHASAPTGNHEQSLTFGWRPLGTKSLPDFDGTLHATDEQNSHCRLVIGGTYTPPGGSAGMLFDRLIGGRISAATLTALLRQLRDAIETDYRMRVAP